MNKVIIPHPFNVAAGESVTDQHYREIFKRTAYYRDWCEKNTTGTWHVDNTFHTNGVEVRFEKLEDATYFQIFAAAFWIHLHE